MSDEQARLAKRRRLDTASSDDSDDAARAAAVLLDDENDTASSSPSSMGAPLRTSSPGIGPPAVRDPQYYFEDGSIVLRVEDTLFKVPNKSFMIQKENY